jgi:hypothetical protein
MRNDPQVPLAARLSRPGRGPQWAWWWLAVFAALGWPWMLRGELGLAWIVLEAAWLAILSLGALRLAAWAKSHPGR